MMKHESGRACHRQSPKAGLGGGFKLTESEAVPGTESSWVSRATETGNGKSFVRHISSMNSSQPTQTTTNHKKRTCSWEYILKWTRTWHMDVFVLEFSILVALRNGIRTRVLESQIFGLKKNLTHITFLVLGHLEWLPNWLPTSCKANFIKHCGSCSWDLQQDERRSPTNSSQVPLCL